MVYNLFDHFKTAHLFPLHFAGIDLSVTNLLLAVLLTLFVIPIPSGWQNLLEI